MTSPRSDTRSAGEPAPSTFERYRAFAQRWEAGDAEPGFSVYEPATGRLLAQFRTYSADDVDDVVSHAQDVFTKTWRHVPARERAKMMRRAAELLREHADEIAEIESYEVGKPIEISRHYDMVVCAESFDFFGSLADKDPGMFFSGGPIDSVVVREPYGVVAGIIPFNWPPVHTAAKLAPALAAGNVVILKPPEQCPLTVLRIVDLLQEVFPEGVIQAVPGTGAETGRALVSHPLVRRISFTGSPRSGSAVLVEAAANHTGTLMELGGKNPFIVYSDADLDLAVAGAIEGSFFNQGEACTAASRLLVHQDIADEFARRFIAATQRLVVGNGLDPSTHIGPMVTSEHRSRVDDYIAIGEGEGATVAYRGEAPADPDLADGYFVPPVVFVDVRSDMRIAQEEIFGPVACIITFSTSEEAITIANSTDFALAAAVYTSSDVTAQAAARDLDAGVVFINNYNRMFLGTPFGGNRASGYGREHWADTMHEFSKVKSIRSPSGRMPVPRWSGATSIG